VAVNEDVTASADTVAGRDPSPRHAGWTFLSNYGHVLVCIAADPTARLRDIAAAVGITERATFNIVDELVDGGYVRRIRDGRRNRYEVCGELPLRHRLEAAHTIGELLRAVAGTR